MLLACALICMLAAPALGTFDVLLTTYGTGTAAGMATTTTTIGGGTILMAALLGTVVKAKILRELHVRRILRIILYIAHYYYVPFSVWISCYIY